MSGSGLLHAQPLYADGEVNWVFLIGILVDGILALFFLFYFNRLFATLLSYAIRAYTWHKFGAYIDISSLQISLLGGRIFFKSVHYHAHNITVYVYDGHITWRYWLRMVQEADVFLSAAPHGSDEPRPASVSTEEGDLSSGATHQDATDHDRRRRTARVNEKSRPRAGSIGRAEKAGQATRKDLPCRISVKVSGVEAFIYNQTPKYDGVVEATMRGATGPSDYASKQTDAKPSVPSSSEESMPDASPKIGVDAEKTDTRATGESVGNVQQPRLPSFLRSLPVRVECKRAAATLGNENTVNVITAKVEKSVGLIDASHAGPLDLFKLVLQFDFENIDVALKPNRDFKLLQLDAARRFLYQNTQSKPLYQKPASKIVKEARSFWSLSWMWLPSKRGAGSVRTSSLKSASNHADDPIATQAADDSQWHGLTRYLDEHEVDEHEEWQEVEYAKVSQLVDVPRVSMRFYFDIPGYVPDHPTLPDVTYADDINGSPPPDYGMELGVHGGEVVYGPWADRQRVNLQNVFFPAACVDAKPSRPLKAGDVRVATVFKIAVVVEADVTLRIPTREESKDQRWKGRAGKARPSESQGNDVGNKKQSRQQRRSKKGKRSPTSADARPYAWLDITVKKDSVVNYVMDFYPRLDGYRNTLDLDVKGLEMSSSANHGLLWRSGSLSLNADLSYPNSWNNIRKWPFTVVCDDLELFILRDHLFLIIDLVNDWASGSVPDFYTFVPFNYQLDMTFRNFCMYLNVNDANIINDPADFERNDFLTLEGQLHAVLGIPMEHFQPKRNQITFDVLAEQMQMRLLSPSRSTLKVFVPEKQMATLPKLTLQGSFDANQETSAGLTDVLRMDIVGTGLSLMAHGFFVRQLINVKENYFGDYMHFKTLEEFQGAGETLEEANAKTAAFPKPQAANELDVILCIVAEDATVMLPTNLYSGDRCIRAELSRANLDLRVTSYYLDMGLNLSPVSMVSGVSISDDEDSLAGTTSETQIFIAHVDLNGHRAFGHPPNEAAYISEWDIDVGKVTGELSLSFAHDLAAAGRSLAFTMEDGENALPVTTPGIFNDVTFVQVRTDVIKIWLHVGRDALHFGTGPITIETGDWAREKFSQRIAVLAPNIFLACVDAQSASRHRALDISGQPVRTYAFVRTGIAIDVVGRKLHFASEVEKQQSHLRENDRRTARASFLLHSSIPAPLHEDDKSTLR